MVVIVEVCLSRPRSGVYANLSSGELKSDVYTNFSERDLAPPPGPFLCYHSFITHHIAITHSSLTCANRLSFTYSFSIGQSRINLHSSTFHSLFTYHSRITIQPLLISSLFHSYVSFPLLFHHSFTTHTRNTSVKQF